MGATEPTLTDRHATFLQPLPDGAGSVHRLAKAPQARPESAAELAEALAAISLASEWSPARRQRWWRDEAASGEPAIDRRDASLDPL